MIYDTPSFSFIHRVFFIGLRGGNGALTAFLGLRTEFRRKATYAVEGLKPHHI